MVRSELASLPANKPEEYLEEYRRRAKSSGVAYLYWFLSGWHYAYLRKWGVQFLFGVTFGGLLVWWFVDLFRTAGMVRNYNKDIATDVLRDLKSISG